MATIAVIQTVFFALVMLRLQAVATRDDFIFLTSPVSTAPPNATAPCLVRGQPPIRRDDYTYMPGFGGYKVHTRAIAWADARLICQEEGGYLTIINSVAESIAISRVFHKSEPIVGAQYRDLDHAFIGFHDFYREGEYVTIHGESLQKAGYDLWDSGQPNNFGIQNCGAVRNNGRLHDLPCGKPYGFICEIPASEDNVDTGALSCTQH